MTRYPTPARPLAGLLALLVALTLAAPPALAAEPTPEPSPTPQPTLADAAEATVEAMPAATLAQAAQAQTAPGPGTAPSDPSFFKTGKGAAVLVLLAAGLGYTVYSFSNDRVKSPNR